MRQVAIELTSTFCNSKCVWCFTQYNSVAPNKGFMEFENYKKIIDLNKYHISVVPFSHGEALLHKDFVKCIEYTIEQHTPLAYFHSNLALPLSDEVLETLSQFPTVTVNIGGTTPEVHKKNMGTDLELVLSNMQKLANLMYNPDRIELKMVVNKNNIHQITDLEVLGRNYGVKTGAYPVYFSTSDSPDNNEKALWYRNNIDGKLEVLCRDKISFEGEEIKVESPLKNSPCSDLFPTIRWDGGLQVCCRPRKHEGIIGDAFKNSIDFLLASPAGQKALSSMKNRKYVSYCEVCS